MATAFLLLPQLQSCSRSNSYSLFRSRKNDAVIQLSKPEEPKRFLGKTHKLLGHSLRASSGDINGATESPKPGRPRKKKISANDDIDGATENRKPARPRKKKIPSISSPTTVSKSTTKSSEETKPENESDGKPGKEEESDDELWDYDDGIDEYYGEPMVCCFGAAQKDFVPQVRVAEFQMHEDIYSDWKMLQWKPPQIGRAPGGPPFNVAIAHKRLGGKAAFMGKLGDDDLGLEMLFKLNDEKVKTSGVKFDFNAKTACSFMRVKFEEDGKMGMEMVREPAEDLLLESDLDLSVLKEARIFHFNSEVLTSPTMTKTLFKAIKWFRKWGGLVFFDVNLPLMLWKSGEETRELIKRAWNEADIIEVSSLEMDFLLDDDYYSWKRNHVPQYFAESFEAQRWRTSYHHTREDLAPLWHDKIRMLFVTDGTLNIHYYTPSFEGEVYGTDDTLEAADTCDRTGSGDAIVAAIMRKLITHPEILVDQDLLERQLRFVICAGIITQWTTGAVRGLPTASAAQNLVEQVYIPSMW